MNSTEVYVLDSSEGALSEDYLPNRLTFQHDAVRTLSRALLAPSQGTGSSGNALAVVSCGARPSLLVPPTSDATSILTLRQSLVQGSCTGGSANFLGALRLALLTAKRSSASSRVVAFLASPASLPEDQCHEVSTRFAEARVSLDVVVLCPLTLTTAATPTSSASSSPSKTTPASATTHTLGPCAQLAQADAAVRTQGEPQAQTPEAVHEHQQHQQQVHTAPDSSCRSSGSSCEQQGMRAADCGGSGSRGAHSALQVEGVREEDLRALRSLTSHHAYAPSPPAPSLRSGPRPPASAGPGMGRSAGPAAARGRAGAGSPGAGAGAGSSAAGGATSEGGLGGQRLVLFPPPDPSLALWQQLEPLLEALQSEGAAEEEHTDGEADGGEYGTGSGGRPSGDRAAADPAAEAAQNAPRPASSAAPLASMSSASPSAARPIPSTTASRFPPRPPPHPHSHRAHRAAAAPSSAPSPSSSASNPGLLRPQPPSLVPSGPLPSRMRIAGGRGITPGSCRYESLDSLQHLSTDGFLRSWLPSYANLSRVWLAPTLPGTPGAPPGLLSGGSGSGAGTGSGAAGSQGQGQGGEAGGSRGGRQGGIGGVTAAGGPGRLCYISVYRLQLPKWHKLLEFNAGCMQELPAGAHPPPLPTPPAPAAPHQPAASPTAAHDPSVAAATAPEGPHAHASAEADGSHARSSGAEVTEQAANGLSRNSSSSATVALASLASDRSTTSSSTGDTSADAHVADAAGADAVASAAPHTPGARPAVPRAPCPVAVHFTTRCSSAAAAASGGGAAATSAGGDGGAGIGGATWVCPDPRRGTLTLVAAVEDPSTVKLLWSERPARASPQSLQRASGSGSGGGAAGGGDAAGCGPPPQESYGSIFPSAEDPGDGGVDVAAAEVEVTLSPTRSRFSLVPHVHGGTIIEVRNPRSVVVRRRQQQQQGQGQGQPASPAASDGGAAEGAGGGTPRDQPQAQQQQLLQPQRVFFWLQQEWPPRKGRDAQDATPAEAATASTSEAAGGAAAEAAPSEAASAHTAAEEARASPATSDPTAATPDGPLTAAPTGASLTGISTVTNTSTAASSGPDVAPAAADGAKAAATVQPSSSRLPPYQSLGTMGYRCASSRAYGLAYGRNASGHGHGHVAGGTGGYGGPRGGGARALVEELQALLECPPEFDPHKHGNRVRCSAAPLQLGPLPLALVEEIMRASGRALNPDGTVTPLTSGSGSSGSGGSGASAHSYPHLQQPSNRRRSSGDSEGGRSGRRYGADGAGGLALGRSPGALVGSPGLTLAAHARRSAGQAAATAAAAAAAGAACSTTAAAGAAAPLPPPTLAGASAANTSTATAAASAVAGSATPNGSRDAGEPSHTAASPFTASVAMAPAAAAVGAARYSALLAGSEAPHVGTRAATPAGPCPGGAGPAVLRPQEAVHAQSAAPASASVPVVRSHPISGPWWEEEEEEERRGGEEEEAGMAGMGLAGRRQGDCKHLPDSDHEEVRTDSGVMSSPRLDGGDGGGGGNAPVLAVMAEGAHSGRLEQAAAAADDELREGQDEEAEALLAREHVSLPGGIAVGASEVAGSRPRAVRTEAAAVVAAAAAAAPTAASLVAAAVAAAAAMERKDSAAANEDASLMFELD